MSVGEFLQVLPLLVIGIAMLLALGGSSEPNDPPPNSYYEDEV